jgi:hypothetical protein
MEEELGDVLERNEMEDVVLLEEEKQIQVGSTVESQNDVEKPKISVSVLAVERILHALTISIALIGIVLVMFYQYVQIGFVYQYPKLKLTVINSSLDINQRYKSIMDPTYLSINGDTRSMLVFQNQVDDLPFPQLSSATANSQDGQSFYGYNTVYSDVEASKSFSYSPSAFYMDNNYYLMFSSRSGQATNIFKSLDVSTWVPIPDILGDVTSRVYFRSGSHYLVQTSSSGDLYISTLNPSTITISNTNKLDLQGNFNGPLELKLGTTPLYLSDSTILLFLNFARVENNVKNWNVGYVLLNGTSPVNVIATDAHPISSEHTFDCPIGSNSTGISISSCLKHTGSVYKCWYTQCGSKIGLAEVKLSLQK